MSFSCCRFSSLTENSFSFSSVQRQKLSTGQYGPEHKNRGHIVCFLNLSSLKRNIIKYFTVQLIQYSSGEGTLWATGYVLKDLFSDPFMPPPCYCSAEMNEFSFTLTFSSFYQEVFMSRQLTHNVAVKFFDITK